MSSPTKHAELREMVERKEERRILHGLIKANIGLSKERAKVLKKIFRVPAANMKKEELEQNNQQRLEGMAQMALLRLNHAKSGSSSSNIGGKDRALEQARAGGFGNVTHASLCENDRKIPEIRVEPPESDEDELPKAKRARKSVINSRSEPEPDANLGVYRVYGYPEGEYSVTFPER